MRGVGYPRFAALGPSTKADRNVVLALLLRATIRALYVRLVQAGPRSMGRYAGSSRKPGRGSREAVQSFPLVCNARAEFFPSLANVGAFLKLRISDDERDMLGRRYLKQPSRY